MSTGSVLRLQEEGVIRMFEISIMKELFCHVMEHLRKKEYNSYWKTKFGVVWVLIPPTVTITRKY
jgi:hypothetical protein